MIKKLFFKFLFICFSFRKSSEGLSVMNDDLKRTNKDLSAKVHQFDLRFKSEKKDITQQVIELKNENTKVKDDANKLTNENKKLREEIQRLSGIISTHESNAKSNADLTKTFKIEKEELDKTKEEQQMLIAKLNGNVVNLKTRIEVLESQNLNMQRHSEAKSKLVDESENKLKQLKQILNDKLQVTEKQSQELVHQKKESDQQLADLQSKSDEYQQIAEKLHKDNAVSTIA